MTAVSAPDLQTDEHAWAKLLTDHHQPNHQLLHPDGGGAAPMVQSSVLIKVDSAPGGTAITADATNDHGLDHDDVESGGAGEAAASTAPGGIGGLTPDAAVLAATIPMPHAMGERKPSFINQFNRQLRSSFRAVSDSPGALQRYRQTRFSNRRVRKRVIFKHGDCNVVQGNVAKRRRRYMQVS